MQTTRDAARDAAPVVVGYVTLGLAAGMLLVAEGLSWWWAPVWSLVIYSGTMQMLLVPLAGGGEPLAAIALSTGFVSGRHVFYGLGFPLERVRGGVLTRLYAVHAITDEVYALLASRERRAMSGRYLVAVEAISHTSWVSGTTIGALVGTALASLVGERIELLGFVLTALFVVLAIENWRNHPDIGVIAPVLNGQDHEQRREHETEQLNALTHQGSQRRSDQRPDGRARHPGGMADRLDGYQVAPAHRPTLPGCQKCIDLIGDRVDGVEAGEHPAAHPFQGKPQTVEDVTTRDESGGQGDGRQRLAATGQRHQQHLHGPGVDD